MLIFFLFFLKALGNPATAAWGEQQSPAGRWHVAARREEEEHGLTACQANLQPGHNKPLVMPPRGRDLTQPHLPQPAGLVWGQTLRIRVLVGDEGLSETPPYKETWAARGRRGWCSSKRVSFSWHSLENHVIQNGSSQSARRGDETPLSQAEPLGILDAFTAPLSRDRAPPGEEVCGDHKKV